MAEIRDMCTSMGIISLALSTDFHRPVSMLSLRTIHRRKRFSLLQALAFAGSVNKYFKPGLIWLLCLDAWSAISLWQNVVKAGTMFLSFGL